MSFRNALIRNPETRRVSAGFDMPLRDTQPAVVFWIPAFAGMTKNGMRETLASIRHCVSTQPAIVFWIPACGGMTKK